MIAMNCSQRSICAKRNRPRFAAVIFYVIPLLAVTVVTVFAATSAAAPPDRISSATISPIAIPRVTNEVVACAAESSAEPAPMPPATGREIQSQWYRIDNLSDAPTLAPLQSPRTGNNDTPDVEERFGDQLLDSFDASEDETGGFDVDTQDKAPPVEEHRSRRSTFMARSQTPERAVPPLSSEDWYHQASELFKRGSWQESIDTFRRVIEIGPQHPLAAQARFYLGRSYLELGVMGRALEAFRDYLVRHPSGKHASAALYRIGQIEFLTGDGERARSTLTEFVGRYKDHPHVEFALPHLGQLAQERDDLLAAARWYRESLRRFPDGQCAAKSRLGLARALDRSGYREAACEIYETLIAEDAGDATDEATFHLGIGYYEAADYEKTVEVLARFEDRSTDDTEKNDDHYRGDASLVRGSALMRLDRLTEATDAFTSAAKYEKTRIEAQCWLGITQCHRQVWADAYKTLTEVSFSAKGKRPELLGPISYYQGLAAQKLNRHDQAYQAFEVVLRCTAVDDPLRDDALMEMANTARSLGDWPKVDRAAGRFLIDFPASPVRHQLRRVWALSYLDRKKLTQAIDVLHVGAADPTNRLAWLDRVIAAAAMLEGDQPGSALAMLDSSGNEAAKVRHAIVAADMPEWFTVRYGACLPSATEAIRTISLVRLGKIDDAEATIDQIVLRYEDCPCGDEAKHRKAVWQSWNLAVHAVADALLQADKLEGAARWYRLASERPSLPEVRVQALRGLAACLVRQDQTDEADEIFEDLLRTKTSLSLRVDVLIHRGRLLEQTGQFDVARLHFEEVMKVAVDDIARAEAMHRSAVILHQQQRLLDAENRFAQLAREYPRYRSTGEALYQHGRLLEDLRQPHRATELYLRVKNDYAQSRYADRAALRAAEISMAVGQFGRAQELTDWIVIRRTIDSDKIVQASALLLSGKAAVARRAWDHAVRRLDEFIARYPESIERLEVEFWRAETDWHAGRIAQAEERYGSLIAATLGRKDAWIAPTRLRFAQAAGLRNDWSSARQRAESLIEDFPEFPLRFEADFLVAMAMLDQGRPDTAREALLRVVRTPGAQQTETGRRARWQVGETYFVQNQYREAIEVFNRLIDSLPAGSPWRVAAKVRLGVCHQRLDQPAAARVAYRSALDEADDRADTSFVSDARAGLEMVDASVGSRTIR